MNSSSVLVVGAGSYLAREFCARNPDLVLRCVEHRRIDDRNVFGGANCVINFAFAPELHDQPYSEALDLDRRIALHAKVLGMHHVMISSRRVYQQGTQWNAKETQTVTGIDAYGENKIRVERGLSELLGNALTILRPGNVVGYEPILGRARFGAYLQNQLRQTGRIRLTVAARTRRDLVPVSFFCRVVREVVLRRPPGIFNVGSGSATQVGHAARWLIEGYGSGEILSESDACNDEFQLDTTRQRSILGLACSGAELEATLRDSGRRLALEAKHEAHDR